MTQWSSFDLMATIEPSVLARAIALQYKHANDKKTYENAVVDASAEEIVSDNAIFPPGSITWALQPTTSEKPSDEPKSRKRPSAEAQDKKGRANSSMLTENCSIS